MDEKSACVFVCVCVCFIYPAVPLLQNIASLQSSRCHKRKLHPLILLISTPSITDGGLISEITCVMLVLNASLQNQCLLICGMQMCGWRTVIYGKRFNTKREFVCIYC